MSKLLAEFRIEFQHGCLVIRDTASTGDISDWEPDQSPYYVDRDSAVLSVLPGVEGPVVCEVWRGEPGTALPITLFSAAFSIQESLEVEDPAGLLRVVLPMIRGDREIRVLVDDRDWPRRVQVLVAEQQVDADLVES